MGIFWFVHACSCLLLATLNNAPTDEDAEGSDEYETTSGSDSSAEEDEYEDRLNASGPGSSFPDRGEGPSTQHIQTEADAEDARVEAAIEGDFDRLIQSIRGADDGESSGMLSRMWDVNLEEREAEFRDDLRMASGVGRTKKKVCSHWNAYWGPSYHHPYARNLRGTDQGASCVW